MDHPTTASGVAKPRWLRVRPPRGAACERVRQVVSAQRLETVCSSAGCPNVGECWSAGVATLMILGGRCSRDCRFCGVPSGGCLPADPDEPPRVAQAAAAMGLAHVVITSVTRDDLPDGGAGIWAETISAVRRRCGGATVEALVPDFLGRRDDCKTVFAARPDVLAHNVETVPRLHGLVRPQADFGRSLRLLRWAADDGLVTKSGLMVGLGETDDEVVGVLERLRAAGVRIVTIGQYLRPSRRHLPVARYVHPDGFEHYRRQAEGMGFDSAACGPRVRSSYQAARQARAAGVGC